MKISPILMVVLFPIHFALAEGPSERSEFFYQPPAGKTAIGLTGTFSPEFSYTISSKPSGAKIADLKVSGQGYSLNIGRGFSEALAIGFGIGYITEKADVTPVTGTGYALKSSGMTDLRIFGQYIVNLSPAKLYLGGRFAVSPGKAKSSTATAEGNEYSGGWSLMPQIGVDAPVGPGLKLGASLTYQNQGDRSINDNGTPTSADVTYKGGSILGITGFAEQNFGKGAVNLSITSNSVSAVDSTTSGTTTTADAYNYFVLNLSGAIYVSEVATILGGVMMNSYPERGLSGTQKVSSYTSNALFVGGRLEF